MAFKESRPNPDELLARLKAEEEKKKRGKLKIFLGYAAGVGKTFTMLENARQRRKEVDTVIAYVETHGRVETEALVEGLEIIPRKQIQYRGVNLTEMDLDAVLARHPKLALVDELAHTNASGSRHPKRYQDVEEILEAGIDVYTTLNIQHIESLRNVVAQITGVWIRETVTDNVIDSAAEIELVDLPPEELLKRLKDGKVYVPAQIADAIEKFFRKSNLNSLRELTMRTAAEHVDEASRNITDRPLAPLLTEKVMVCITPTQLGPRLVRSARRLAYQMGAEWFAVYVERPGSRLTQEQEDHLNGTLRLAEKLGANVMKVQGTSVVAAINDFASQNKITKIVVGKPERRRWRNLFSGGSIVNQLMQYKDHFDLFVVSGIEEHSKEETISNKENARQINWRGYGFGLGLVILATLFGVLVRNILTPTTIVMIYMVCVVIAAIFGGMGPSILVSVLGVLAFDLFLVEPYLSFRISDTEYFITFIVLVVVGLIISYLTSRFKQQMETARRGERQTAALFALGRDLAIANDIESYIHAIIQRVKETIGFEANIFLPDTEGKLNAHSEDSSNNIDENELAAAIWSFEHQKIVGRGTDTLPNAKARYLPLVTARKTVGVISVWTSDPSKVLGIEQERLMDAYVDLAAVAIEGIQSANEALNAQVLKDTERLQTALLNSISHELRTPLVSIIGVLSSLQEEGMNLDDAAKKNLILMARNEAERLNRLISNLLSESRIEAGALKLSQQQTDIKDLVDAAVEQLGNRTAGHPIKIDVPDDLPLVTVDFGLIVQTLVNVLDNAIKYSPAGSDIEMQGRQVNDEVEIEVADRGSGIPAEDLSRVFDKFYLVQSPASVTGIGLGLSICKGIVEAHKGRIVAVNRQGGGTIIKMILPAVGG